MDADVGRIRESLFVPHVPGRGGRRRERGGERFRLDEEAQPRAPEHDATEEDAHHEHGRVGRPDDDEAGRRIDLTG